MGAQQLPDAENLLNRWFREGDDSRARVLMETLVCHYAEPVIRRIVSFKLRASGAPSDGGSARGDVEDVCGAALYSLLARLDRIKSGDDETPVRNFTGYAAVTAYNACNEYFRAKKPAWARLSMRLRYLATHAPGFGLWQSREGRDVCGRARDRGREVSADPSQLEESCKDLWERQDAGRLSLAELVEAILDAAGGPLFLDDLVDTAAEWSGVKEAPVQALEPEAREKTAHWEPQDSGPSAEARLRARQYMDRLWTEICALPLEHRKALLFNLQDSAGGDIQLFDFLGIATIPQIAAALEIEPLAFAELWKRLPLDDTAIGLELGLSRQDVANRRSSARKRLARKMKEFEYGNK